ncbi:MAG: hypothetical protein ABIN01_16335 [Ferruginibacter sp.]
MRRLVNDNLIMLSNYVTMVALGDTDILLSSRFEVRKTNITAPPLEAPVNIRALMVLTWVKLY